MDDAPKKRGRQAAKAKETKTSQTAIPESEVDPLAVEPSKGKGKRKAVSETPKAKKEAGTKKAKVDEPLPEETIEELDTAAQTNTEAPMAKKSRSKKDSAEKAAVVPKETKAPRKKATPKAEKADSVDHDQQKNGSTVKEDQPTASKRNRGKPSYKDEESDEPEYNPKPTKGRGKAKADANVDNDNASEKKPATKRAAKTKEATDESLAPAKPTARGRKKAPTAEATVDDAEEKFVTKRKITSQKEEATTSTAPAKPTARGRKKALVAETTADVGDEGEEKAATEVSSSNGVTERKRSKDKTNDQEEDSAEVKVATKGRKAKEAAPSKMNKCATDFESLNFEPEVRDKEWNFKISSWNVAGLRAWVTKGGLEFLQHERPDILCVQETKCTEDQLPDEARQIPGYHPYWLCPKGGDAGVAIYSKKMPFHVSYGLGDEEQDQDGRLLTAEYEKFYLVCVYVPNAGRKLVTLPKRMRWDEKFQKYLVELNNKKPIILCGDMNVSHQEIDLANPKANRRNAGFTQEERDGMTKMLSLGFVDTFRRLYPDRERAYTFWTYMAKARAKDIGWRLDYFILSERLVDKVVDNVIRSKVYGSDHCPVTLFLNI